MLLPSAFPCDSQPPLTRLQASLFASPPASPPQLSAQTAFGNLFSSCRSLQSRLASPIPIARPAPISPPGSSHAQQLPTPPMAHTPAPMKLRLRSRKPDGPPGSEMVAAARKRIVKRAPVPRGLNKRRRSVEDDLGREDDDVESDLDISEKADGVAEPADELPPRPSTPKRSRIAPEALPLGLDRADFHALRAASGGPSDDIRPSVEGTDVEVEADGEAWTVEDDRILVELVLEKLKLSKSDWQDCARSLGKDRSSVGRRWKSLMLNGDVGVKRTSRRSKIHGTWR